LLISIRSLLEASRPALTHIPAMAGARTLFAVSSGIIVASSSAAAAKPCAPDEEGTCAAGSLSHDSLLLQLESKSAPQTQKLPVMPPPYTESSEQRASSAGLAQMGRSQMGSPSQKELDHFKMLKDLRRSGYQCPSKYFPGIPDTESTFLFDCRLWRAARLWSEEMGGPPSFFAHKRGSSTPCTRTAEQGLEACGENIAAGNSEPDAALEQWKKSDGHCVNMMDPNYNRFGIGHAEVQGSDYTHYWTQALGWDGGVPDTSCLGQQPQPSPQPQPPQPPAPSGPCEDKDPNCERSYKNYCNYQNIKESCPVTCGLCQPAAPQPQPSPQPLAQPSPTPQQGPCKDNDRYCTTSYKDLCYLDNIKQACQKTCGQCQSGRPQPQPMPQPTPQPAPWPTPQPAPQPTPPPQQGSCRDTDRYCTTAYKDLCYLDNIKQACPKTCGQCSNSAGNSASSCKDMDVHCSGAYKDLCYLDNIKESCPKTCRTC